MTPNEAIEEILKDLSISFGDRLASQIVMSARSSVPAPPADFGRRQYAEVVRTVCGDARVVGMLGELTVKERQSLWEKLVS